MHKVASQPALLSGVARRISAEEKRAIELAARPAILRATIQITRAATGKVEEYQLIGKEVDAAGAPLCGLDTVRQERGRINQQLVNCTETEKSSALRIGSYLSKAAQDAYQTVFTKKD